MAAWLARPDLSDKLEDFIAICEARFNRRLRVRAMETEDTSFTIDDEKVALPLRYRGTRDFWYTGGNNGRTRLRYKSPQDLRDTYNDTTTGPPLHFTVLGDYFVFGPTPDASYTANLIYYTGFAALGSGNATNVALTNHPDLYLYGSLAAAEGYLQNDPRLMFWKQQLDEIIGEIRDEEHRDAVTGSALEPKAAYGERRLR